MKNFIFTLIVMCCMVLMSACKSGKQNGNVPKGFLSVADFSSDDIIVMGTYEELVNKMGKPEKFLDTYAVAKIKDSSIRISRISYDGITYIRHNDSVQLSFVDFRRSCVKLTLQIGNGEPLTIDSNTLCDEFYAYMDKYVLPDGDCLTLPDEDKMSFEGHYMTDGMYYALGFVSDTLDKRHSNYIFPIFTPQDKRLWYIEFSIVDMGGLYRN